MRVLYVDDDKNILEDTKEILENSNISGEKPEVTIETDFNNAISKLDKEDFDLIVIDVYQGRVDLSNPDRRGVEVLTKVRNTRFIPVIFYTGLVNQVQEFDSEVVRIVRKSEGSDKLKSEMDYLVKSGLMKVRKTILDYVDKTIRRFFWEFVENNWGQLKNNINSEELILLLVRRLSLLLSKENLSDLLLDSKDKSAIVKPLEFYVFPPVITSRFEMGDILFNDGKVYVILTPTCDLFPRGVGSVKVDSVVMVRATPLEERAEYKEYMEKESRDKKDELTKLVSNRKSTLFFLPKFPLMDAQVVDFQNLLTEDHKNLSTYKKIAKLDSPFAESMLANFLRVYNRIGIPDIDIDNLINSFKRP